MEGREGGRVVSQVDIDTAPHVIVTSKRWPFRLHRVTDQLYHLLCTPISQLAREMTKLVATVAM